MSTLLPFTFTTPNLPTGPASKEQPLTNPIEMLLCHYPLGRYRQNPNFMLVHARPNPFDEYQGSLYAILTAGSDAPLAPSTDPLKKKFWMKTYSENKGMLEQLEAQGILRRTGEEEEQGYVKLIAVETIIQHGQWAEFCSGCETYEDLGGETRLLRCSVCKDTYYCKKECQTTHWPLHKAVCKQFRKEAAAAARRT
ncbi:hypothetical protein BJ875DRAFT_477109 [Amylocarpus encephaloides]|uniref:MYND-type domain-containing protein n=1 Tax=Amylocarpus encephaloides TaxID=45428 RepID=A0A9P8BZS2_9HELO|nr:hypothetical protein BJ875DRAFT_477109 [Amylocarpus encephaloides]